MYISTDKNRLDLELIHQFLSTQTLWAKNIHFDCVKKSVQNSLCFGAYSDDDQQVGFCRVISDFATFANLVDVFVLPNYRGQGISKQLMQAVKEHSELQGLRRFTLATKDAHGLYRQFGFTPLNHSDTFMEILDPWVYSPK